MGEQLPNGHLTGVWELGLGVDRGQRRIEIQQTRIDGPVHQVRGEQLRHRHHIQLIADRRAVCRRRGHRSRWRTRHHRAPPATPKPRRGCTPTPMRPPRSAGRQDRTTATGPLAGPASTAHGRQVGHLGPRRSLRGHPRRESRLDRVRRGSGKRKGYGPDHRDGNRYPQPNSPLAIPHARYGPHPCRAARRQVLDPPERGGQQRDAGDDQHDVGRSPGPRGQVRAPVHEPEGRHDRGGVPQVHGERAL